MNAVVKAVRHAFPATVLGTKQLAEQFPDWSVEKIAEQTGIHERRIAAERECTSDLAAAAVENLFSSTGCAKESVDFLILCTQTPDYFLPPTACILQDRLGLPQSAGAFDFNLGSSGYVYGLGLAQGLISSGQASNILLVTADTYTKFVHPEDRSTRTIFGDAAAVTWISAGDQAEPSLGPFVYGTDGSGAENLIVQAGGLREPRSAETRIAAPDDSGNVRSPEHLYMNGMEIFAFTMRVVPRLVKGLLEKASLSWDDIDLVIFHQANMQMLQHLRKSLRIPESKFYTFFGNSGNTVSATIPLALEQAIAEGRVSDGARIMLVGFGVGYSWGATILRWRAG